MKSLAQHLAFYGSYHRDPRNKMTHFIGVPAIMFSILVAASWVRAPVGGVEITLAMLALPALLSYYFLLDKALAAAMAIFVSGLLYVAEMVAQLPFPRSLAVFAAAFVGGWIFQLAGHAFEGRKPALVDNVFQVIVAPLFLMAEVFFALGKKRELRQQVDAMIQERLRSEAQGKGAGVRSG